MQQAIRLIQLGGDVEGLVNYLLEHDDVKDARDAEDRTLLHHAAEANNEKACETLISVFALPVNAEDTRGKRAIELATETVVRTALFKQGAVYAKLEPPFAAPAPTPEVTPTPTPVRTPTPDSSRAAPKADSAGQLTRLLDDLAESAHGQVVPPAGWESNAPESAAVAAALVFSSPLMAGIITPPPEASTPSTAATAAAVRDINPADPFALLEQSDNTVVTLGPGFRATIKPNVIVMTIAGDQKIKLGYTVRLLTRSSACTQANQPNGDIDLTFQDKTIAALKAAELAEALEIDVPKSDSAFQSMF